MGVELTNQNRLDPTCVMGLSGGIGVAKGHGTKKSRVDRTKLEKGPGTWASPHAECGGGGRLGCD